MFVLGPIGFTAPYALLALVVLPALWWLLRITPPAPQVIRFPAIRLLRDLARPEETPARTPLWLILMRMMLTAAIILGLAGPILHPDAAASASSPLLVVVDNGWASAPEWPVRLAALNAALDRAERSGRTVTVLPTAPGADGNDPAPIGPSRAATIRGKVASLKPQPWPNARDKAAAAVLKLDLPKDTEVEWLSDGLDDSGARDLGHAVTQLGNGRLLRPSAAATAYVLLPPVLTGTSLKARVVRAAGGFAAQPVVRVMTSDGRVLASASASFEANDLAATASFDLPTEIMNEADRVEIAGQRSAAATVLLDTRYRRRPVGIVSSSGAESTLLNGNTYLKAALQPFTDLKEGTLDTLLKQPISTLVLDDPPALSDADQETLRQWTEQGGILIRFAGPHLAAAPDKLLPVDLREGDRQLGGALSWAEPAHLAPFPDKSPLAGITVPDDVTVSRQVLAQPGPDLDGKVWAALTDGTPLVTATASGKGWIVLVHTTASPDWSNLCLSGVFVDMLRRINDLGAGVAGTETGAGALAPIATLDGFAALADAPSSVLPIEAGKFETVAIGPLHPPGYYGSRAVRRALNLSTRINSIAPLPDVPGLTAGTYSQAPERSLKPWLLGLAMLVLGVDALVALWLKGLLLPTHRVRIVACLALAMLPGLSHAAVQDKAERAATVTSLAYVQTGDREVDAMSDAGLKTLAKVLISRTSIDTADVAGIDLEQDDLTLYPLLYWPIVDSQATPSPAAISRLNRYLATGGMILFDTRQPKEGISESGTLRRLASGISIPALEQLPEGHTLTKSFYLLSEFPGRYTDAPVWVEQSPSDKNDNVSSVILGGNDWAAAWAIDQTGAPLVDLPGGPRQQEMAWRFGVNVVMYALTGNYKSDQVHTPIILERLGQ
jgi:hypothetical protein